LVVALASDAGSVICCKKYKLRNTKTR